MTEETRKPCAFCMAVRVALVLTVVGLAGLFLGYRALKQAVHAPGPAVQDQTIIIPAGESVKAISRLLHEQGVIENPRLFKIWVRLKRWGETLKAGEYHIPARASMVEVMDIVIRGVPAQRVLTIPEGQTVARIVRLLNDHPDLTGEIKGNPAEGTLLPETYHFSRGDTRTALLRRMQQAMNDAMREIWQTRFPDLPFNTPQEMVILASIVEKETALARERPKVAGVFVNRLRKDMRLQADPTVIYAMTLGKQDLGRPLTRKDWQYDSPYNTYRVTGLPPSPIANPGRESLAAAVNPAEHNYIYFVADGSGGHAFAKTLAQHNRNVAAWRKSRQ